MNDSIRIMNENKEQQYIYIMSNSSFSEDMLKIGWTRGHPNIRANELYTTGVPTPFIIEFSIITTDGAKLEKKIHEHIKDYRVNSNREFFKIPKDKLTEILTKELNLELTPIIEIIAPINKKRIYCKKVNEIKLLIEELEKEVNEFFSKLNKDKTELVIKKVNNKKYVSIRKIETEYNITSLTIHGFEDDDEREIKNEYYFINRNTIKYKEMFVDLIDNYEEIKNRITVEQFRLDNKLFKEMILDTHKRLNNIKNEYI